MPVVILIVKPIKNESILLNSEDQAFFIKSFLSISYDLIKKAEV
jgi:hypothetical protein